MTTVRARDGVSLHVEEAGSGTPIVFIHEYAGDHRSWEPQLRHFSQQYRCITFSQRGYPPSDVPSEPDRYSQAIARDDVIAVMDGLGIEQAHLVGHSMGAYTALHVGISSPGRCLSLAALGCGWGSSPDKAKALALKAMAAEIANMFATEGIAEAARKYASAPMRHVFMNKDPRGWGEFARMLAEHSGEGHAHIMRKVQLERPSLWDLEAELARLSLPLLIIVGDEDDLCLDGSVFLKRTVRSSALLVIPRAGHTINSEEPAAVNAALAELFCAVAAKCWLSHKPNQI
jgi:pimeloyl-ACP methyl ester carboxylesterase